MGTAVPITFTLDTICPWTYIAKRRLGRAISEVREEHPDVEITVRFLPYQLYPDLPREGEDKLEWYQKSRYGDSEEKMKMYTTLMSAYGVAEGIDFKFGGTMANTLQAHRTIHHFQETQGPEVADKLVNGLYRRFFEEQKHPASLETLLEATIEAGVSETEARSYIENEDEDLMDVKLLIREQAGNGIDSVPYVVIEGKRRDFTMVGAKEVDEYIKAIQQCIKEYR
ncbi:Structural maintenance of chromosomes protein 4 [Sphaceloma murrayae]|uniref:Structural maintenance of chromosomes protein 4 n=1 Tax=Sphaceloma murrayae TaxID=2082308 RepID=A0A2K1QYW0_9PEZI|nr:Structural maintenance of chromosomes protein 4 [Sphaceloma murrayae]